MMLRPLRPGDNIALIAPSSPFDKEKFSRARALLEGKGYRLSTGAHISKHKGYLAGTDAERAEDLVGAISDPEISAVMCVRGGYGSSRLLPWLPFSSMRSKAKIVIGYSDITFLHLAFSSQMGWITFHGPNLMDLVDNPERCDVVLSALQGETSFSWVLKDHYILREGSAKGMVIGGNLTCLAHLVGTPYMPDLRNTLLLVEDCCEALYRLDRLLTQLMLAGILHQLGGLILGQFKDCGDEKKIVEMVLEQVKLFNFPVVAGLPFGHVPVNEAIPFGVPFELNTYERTFRALQHPFSS